MPARLKLKDFLEAGDVCHFARTELGVVRQQSVHTHDFCELFWVESGTGLHVIQQERREVRPGSLIFVLPSDSHTIGSANTEERFQICNLAFPTKVMESFRQRFPAETEDWFAPGETDLRERVVPAKVADFLRRTGDEWIASARSTLMLERFLLNLAVELQKPLPPAGAGPVWLVDALAAVERQGLFREGPSALTRLARRSQEHVVREANRWFHKTPSALMNDMRMRHAAQCLSSTNREILDICYDCGLENVGHFYGLFKKEYGMTPREYRLRSQAIVKPR